MRTLLLVGWAGLVMTLPCTAQTDPPPAAAVDAEAALAGIERSLGEMVELLRRQVEQQDVALAMNRVELLTFVQLDVDRRLEERKQSGEYLEQSIPEEEENLREMAEELSQPGPQADPDELRMRQQMIERMERRLVEQRAQLKKLELQVTDLENQAAGYRDDILRWQERIDRYFARPPGR